MNVFSFIKKNILLNKKTKANGGALSNFTKVPTRENLATDEIFDSLEEKFLRIDILIGKCKLVLQNKFEKDLETFDVEQVVCGGLNKSRQLLIDRLVEHRDHLLKNANPKITVEIFMKFKKNSRQPTIDDYFFSTYFNLDHRLDLIRKIKYLKLLNKTHEVMNKKRSSDYFNSWYGEIEILPLSENRLFFYFKSSNLLQITNMQRQVISKVYLDLETFYVECFDFINFKANSTVIVFLRHVYNQTLIVLFDMKLNELKRLHVIYKSDFCIVNETEILLKEINSNNYHLYNLDLDAVPFKPKLDHDETIIKLTEEKIYSFNCFKGMNIIKIASRYSNQNRIQLSLFTKQPISRNQIKINLKQKLIIVLDRDKLKLFDMNGSVIGESERDVFLKACDSIELVNDFDQGFNKNACIYSINRYKNTFFLI
jgi:hypothetical protein